MASSGWLQEAHSDDSELTEESEDELPTVTPAGPRRPMYDSDESEEEEKRTVKTAKQKMWEQMTTVCKQIKQHLRIKDFVQLLSDFMELNQQLGKAQNIVDKEGVPVFYIRALVRLEDVVNETTKEEHKKMSRNNAQSFNKLKAGLKKNGKSYETELAEFRTNPVASEDSFDEEDSEDEEAKAVPVGDDEDSDWGSDDEDEDDFSEDDDDEDYDFGDRGTGTENRRKFWELKPGQTNESAVTITKKERARKAKTPGAVKVVGEGPSKVVYTPLLIENTLKEIREMRGRKSGKTKEYLEKLNEILEVLVDEAKKLEVIKLIIIYQFEQAVNAVNYIMKKDIWNTTCDHLVTLVNGIDLATEGDRKELDTNFVMYIERLNEELKKVLINIDPAHPDYLERMKDYLKLTSVIHRFETYYAGKPELARIALLKLEHIHYVHSSLREKMQAKFAHQPDQTYFKEGEDFTGQVEALLQQVLEVKNKDYDVKAMLMVSFHYSLHGNYVKAREYFQMTELHENFIADPQIQVLYNRGLAQLGLCAFANGKIVEAFHALNEIVASMRIRDFLGQSGALTQYKTEQQEREAKRRLLPFHMHMNSSLLEAMYFITAMLIDVPKIPSNDYDPYGQFDSDIFRKLIQFYEKKALIGPPENNRDYIIQTIDILKRGAWKEAQDTLKLMPAWKIFPLAEQATQNILPQLKQSAMVTYIFAHRKIYESFSLEQLAKMFELSQKICQMTVAKLIETGSLKAEISGDNVSIHPQQSSKSAFLIQSIHQKIGTTAELNTKLQDYKGLLTKLQTEVLEQKKMFMQRGVTGNQPTIPKRK